MPFLNAAIFLLGQLSEHLAQVPAQVSVQHFAPALGYENNVVLGLASPLHYDTNHVSTTQLCHEKAAFPTTFSKLLTTIVTAPVRNAG
jgi:hypothetical protein